MAKAAWRKYEEHILRRVREWAGPDAAIEFDVERIGKFSGRKRQIESPAAIRSAAGASEMRQVDG